MKNIHGTIPTPEFTPILTRPSRMVPYESAPERLHSYRIAKQGMPLSPVEMHELGSAPKTTSVPPRYEVVPDVLLHELADVLLYDGILYSKQGGFFPDSVRAFDKNSVCNFYYGPTSQLKHLGNNAFVPDDPSGCEDVVEPDTIFLPCFTSHMVYGHWLLEAASSLWALPYFKALAKGAPVKLLLSPVSNVPEYMKQFAAFFGVTEHDYYFPSKCMRIKKLFIPTKVYMHMAYVSPFAQKVWAAIGAYYQGAATVKPVDKLYLSRRRVKKRQMENEEACEALFVRHGFTVVHPQELPLADQIQLFSNATHIAGPVGSAVHNVVFSQHPGTLKTLFWGPGDYTSFKAIALLEQAYGRKANFVIGKPRNKESRSWHIPLKELEIALNQWLAQ